MTAPANPSIAPSVARAAQRLPGIDALRFVAAAAIVWIHAFGLNPAHAHIQDLGRFAVPFFTAAAVALLAESLQRGVKPYGQYLRGRVVRIYVPFLVWSLAYLLLREFKHVLRPGTETVRLGPHLLLTGAAYHLWFLPFILIVTAVAYPVLRVVVRGGTPGVLVAAACGLAGLAIAVLPSPFAYSIDESQGWERPRYLLALGWATLPAALWTLALAGGWPALRRRFGTRAIWAAGALVLAAVGSMLLARTRRSDLPENLLGMCCLLGALGPWRGGAAEVLAWLGTCAYGIYLSHVVFVLGFDVVLGGDHATLGIPRALAIFCASLVGSTVLSILLARSRWTRWLVP